MKYVIQINGRKHRYGTLEAAKAVAEAIFQQTGVVVGITHEAGR